MLKLHLVFSTTFPPSGHLDSVPRDQGLTTLHHFKHCTVLCVEWTLLLACIPVDSLIPICEEDLYSPTEPSWFLSLCLM